MRYRFGIIVFGLLAWASPALAENKLAFVVGINDYPHLGPESQLSRAVADADAVGDTLESIGFQVTRVTHDAVLDTILERFETFKATVQPGDTVFFYYAGHGVSLDDGNYLIPSDIPALGPTDERLAKRHALAERDIKQDLRHAGARVAVVVLDACRNNPFPARGTRALGAGMRGLARLDPQDGIFSLYSAREGQTALDRLSDSDADRNSVFTRVFLRALKTPGMSLSDLGESVRDDVAALARGQGHDQVPAVSNDLIGARSVFLAGPAPVPAVIPPVAMPPAIISERPKIVATLPADRPAGTPPPAPRIVEPVAITPDPQLQAAPPSFEQAETLTTLLESYLDTSPGSGTGRIIISPYGEAYRASFDLKRIVEGLELGMSLEPATQTISLKPQGGVWQLASGLLPRLAIRAGNVSIKTAADSAKFDATFDPALPGFAGGTLDTDGAVFDIVAPPFLRRQRIGHGSLIEKAVPAENGATSIELHYAMTDIVNRTLVLPPSPGQASRSGDSPLLDKGDGVVVTARGGTIDTHLDRLRLRSLIDLRAFFMVHPRPDADAALFEQLRTILRDVLPVLTGLRQNLAFKGVEVTLPTSGDGLAADKLDLGLDIEGLQAAGHAGLALAWDGFSFHGTKVPPWALNLCPTSGMVKATLWGFHLGEAGRRLVDDYDVTLKTLPPGDGVKIAHVALPMGGLQVLVEPSRITSRLMQISFEGEINNLPGDPTGNLSSQSGSAGPTAHFTITATGIDKAIASLQAAVGTEEGAGEILAKLVAIKTLGRAGADGSMDWALDFSASTLSVNGTVVK